MSANLGDIRSLAATLRRHGGILGVAALLGLLAGSAYVIVAPAPLTSTALVLLPTPALAESSNSDVATQVRIATSANILQRAGEEVGPGLSERQVEKMVKVSGATDQLLQIDAKSTDAAEAQKLAQAVADSYVNYVRNTALEVTQAVLGDLNNRKDDLQETFDQLSKEITASTKRKNEVDPDTAEGRAEARLLGSLTANRSGIAQQLESVKNKIAAGTPLGSSATGTSVVQQATLAVGPSLPIRLLVSAPAGALAAVLFVGALVLLITRRDTRVRLRDDLADAISSPVLGSLRSRPQRSAAAWSTLLESYKATPVEGWALRQILRGLSPGRGQIRVAGRVDHPQSVTVISVSGDPGGLAIGPQLAAFAASLGIATRLVPTIIGRASAPTLWACTTEGSTPNRPNLFVGDVPSDTKVELTVFLVVVERVRPDLGNTPASESTILAVAAGTATEQELARVAVAVDDSGRRIDGIVVADPDEADRTTGRHTIAERSQWPTMPTRLTGVAPTAPADVRSRP